MAIALYVPSVSPCNTNKQKTRLYLLFPKWGSHNSRLKHMSEDTAFDDIDGASITKKSKNNLSV